MLILDHIPFYGGQLGLLRSAFEKLGFQVSPSGRYSSPDYPERSWLNHSVFLYESWFDLIASARDGTEQIHPGACLLRTDDLPATLAELGDELVRGPRYKLVREWDDDRSLPSECFELAGLSWKAGPLPVSVVQHQYPCADARPEWFEHANGAVAIAGLTLGDEGRSDVPEALLRSSDLSWLHLQIDSTTRVPTTVTVRVRSIPRAEEALTRNDVTYRKHAHSISPVGLTEFGCAWEFIE